MSGGVGGGGMVVMLPRRELEAESGQVRTVDSHSTEALQTTSRYYC